MGPSIMATAALWRSFKTFHGRLVGFALATAAVALFTPVIRSLSILHVLPDPIEAYVRPVGGLSNFVFPPWMAFVFAGAFCGVLIDAVRTPATESRLNWRFGSGGLTLGLIALGASFLPSPYAYSYFWTTSPAFFFLRLGILVALIGFAYAWQQRPGGTTKWSPLQQLGRTSLFIYWIHVEMVYGLVTRPIHKTLSLPAAWFAVVGFTLLMVLCSVLKERITARRMI
jgi:fucose 4-O-acetylase-like acetyltransferase